MQRLQDEGRVRSAMLCIQYRMPEMLARVVSEHFYGGQLQRGKATDSAIAQPLRARDVVGVACFEPKSTSRLNLLEADAAVAAARRLHEAEAGRETTRRTSIAILTPYAAQLARIQSLLAAPDRVGGHKAVGGNAIEAMSVDASQGREWDHVVLSLVVSNPQGLGFVKHARRQCVAMSRAKRTATLVWHPDVACALPAWASFYDLAAKEPSPSADESPPDSAGTSAGGSSDTLTALAAVQLVDECDEDGHVGGVKEEREEESEVEEEDVAV
jgi:superfamily I DNA and/or RNA helicase